MVRTGTQRNKRIRDTVSVIGSPSETNNLLKNDAAKKVAHLVGEKAAIQFGEELESLRRNPQQYSMVFKDGGLRLKAIAGIGEHGRVTDFPTDVADLRHEFENYMVYCETFLVSPTIGLFATWLGVSFEDYERKIVSYEMSRPDVAAELRLCKEVLRGFLETQALDSNVPPAVYLHQNKAYYDAVEANEVRHVSKTEEHVRDSEKIDEIIMAIPVEDD